MTQLTLAPCQRHSDTSRAAADSIAPIVTKLQAIVLDAIRGMGDSGATDEELQTALVMNANTERPRRVELVTRGLVRDSGKRRLTRSQKSAVVWVAA